MLDQEREFFDEIREELVDKHLRKFVLIKEKNLIGTYNGIAEALSEGARNAVGANLKSQGIIALIGRDFLQHCALYHNGVSGQITLSL